MKGRPPRGYGPTQADSSTHWPGEEKKRKGVARVLTFNGTPSEGDTGHPSVV